MVYYYNRLPPNSLREFVFGKRCAIVGAGNVMADIARYLIREVKVQQVMAVVRRGPAEVKFDKQEMEHIIANLDQQALEAEIARVSPIMKAVGQDPEAARLAILEALPKADPKTSETCFRFEFLTSPIQMLGEGGQLSRLEGEDTTLILKDGDTKARGTGHRRLLDVETVIFAIGDKVDESFGLPTEWNEFVKNKNPRFPVEGNSYEVFDPDAGAPIEGVFVGGWSRVASHGLVGYARKDGINAARAVWDYLQTRSTDDTALESAIARIKSLPRPVVTKDDLERLEEVEAKKARESGLEEFKFSSNQEMLQAMGLPISA